MTSSEASLLVKSTCRLISDEVLWQRVEAPLEQAALGFVFPARECWDAIALDEVLVRFIQHLHIKAFVPERHLAHFDALSEAVTLLDEGYVSQSDRGYEAAVVDVMADGAEAVEFVAASLLASLRQRRRAEYIRWVLTSSVGGLGWRECCSLVSALVDQNADILPDELKQGPASRWASRIPDLILAIVRAKRSLSGVAPDSPFA